MKKTILMLFVAAGLHAQNAVQHYFISSQNLAGAEMILKTENNNHFGAGFTGTLKNEFTRGEWVGKNTTFEEMKYSTGVAREEWCSLYGVVSVGYLKGVQVSFNAGAGLYGQMRNFKINEYEYHKNDKLIYVPLIGIAGQYEVIKDFGVFAGYDTFSGFKIGASVLFN